MVQLDVDSVHYNVANWTEHELLFIFNFVIFMQMNGMSQVHSHIVFNLTEMKEKKNNTDRSKRAKEINKT